MEIIVRILQIKLRFVNLDIYMRCIFACTMSFEKIWAMQVYYTFDFEEKFWKPRVHENMDFDFDY